MINYDQLKTAVFSIEPILSKIEFTSTHVYKILNTDKLDKFSLSKIEASLYYLDSHLTNTPLTNYQKFKTNNDNNKESDPEQDLIDFLTEQEYMRRKAELFLLPLRVNLAVIASELNLTDIKDLCSKDDLTDENLEKIQCLVKELKKLF